MEAVTAIKGLTINYHTMKSSWKKLHLLTKVGIILFLFGSAPFFIVMALDALGLVKSGNLALGTGPLVFLTFYPSLILIAVGALISYRKRKNETRNATN